jgi:hypothetical protein
MEHLSDLMSAPSPLHGTLVWHCCLHQHRWMVCRTGIDAYMITAGPNTDEVVIATT